MKAILLEGPTARVRLGASVPARAWQFAPTAPGTPSVEGVTRRDFPIGAGGIGFGGAKPKKPEAARERAS